MRKIVIFLFFLLNYSYAQTNIQEQLSTPGKEMLKTSFISETTGWLVLSDRIKKTTDSGNNWVDVAVLPNLGLLFRDIKFINENEGWLISRYEILKTTDGGVTWVTKYYEQPNPYGSDPNNPSYPSYSLKSVDFHNNVGIVGIQTCDNLEPNGTTRLRWFLKSTDNGETWTKTITDPSHRDLVKIVMKSETEYWAYSLFQLALPTGEINKVRRTIDGGITWSSMFIPFSSTNFIEDIYFKGDTTYFGGRYSSFTPDNGPTSISMSQNESNPSTYLKLTNIRFVSSNVGFAIGNTEGYTPNSLNGSDINIFQTKTKGQSWELLRETRYPNYEPKTYKYLDSFNSRIWFISADNKLYSFKNTETIPDNCSNVPFASITGQDSETAVGYSANIKVEFGGLGPFSFKLNDEVFENINSNPYIAKVYPTSTTTYQLTNLRNACGVLGGSQGSASVTVYPTCTLPFASVSGTYNVLKGSGFWLPLNNLSGMGTIYVIFNGQEVRAEKFFSSVYLYPQESGTYSISLKNICGTNVATGSITINVTCNPSNAATLSGETKVYSGDSVNLNVSFVGNPPFSFNLMGNDINSGLRVMKSFSNITTTNFGFKVGPISVTTSYFLDNYKDACGDGDENGFVITQLTNCVKAEPTLTTETPTIYSGEGGALIYIDFQEDLPKPFPYRFREGSFYSYGNPEIQFVNPSTTTTYVLESYYDECVNRYIAVNKEITITVLPSTCIKATATISGNQTINRGETATISVDLTGTPPYNLVIAHGSLDNRISYENIQSSPFILNVSPQITTEYFLHGVSNQCQQGTFSGSATVTVIIPNCNSIDATLAGKQTIREGEIANLTINTTGDLPYNMTINGTTYNDINVANYTLGLSPILTTNYTISNISNICGSGTAQGNIKVSVIPNTYCPEEILFDTGLHSRGEYIVGGKIESKAFSLSRFSYSAGESILLLPGFEVKDNVFLAKIEGCVPLPPIPTTGLIMHLPLNGNGNDATGNNNNAQLDNVAFNTDRFGNPASACSFFGYNVKSALRIPNSNSIQFSNSFSISIWYYQNTYAGMDGYGWEANNGYQMLFAKEGDWAGFYAGISSNPALDSVSYNFTNAGNFNTNVSTKSLTENLNKWVHMVYVAEADKLKIFKNGVKIKETALIENTNFATANTRDLYFGRYSYYWYPFDGKMDDIRMYNRALSDSEVTTLFNAEK